MRVAVAGTGYVGLVTGVVLAHIGHDVICVDIDEDKVKRMASGICPIYEADLEDLMKVNKDRLDYTINYKNAYKNAEVIIIGVGTPEREDGSANLDYVFGVAKQIAQTVENDCVIVVKSTVPIGTNDEIEKYIKKNLKHKVNVYVASNPEFLAQGTAVRDTLYASRIVVGAEDEKAQEIMKNLYLPLTMEPYNAPYVTMNRKSAEMVKYASNDFLALKISYINEIANFCERVGANIEDVTKGMGYDSRIGNKFLSAGIGYGGSCFPKDTKALHWLSKELNTGLKTIEACIEVNKEQKLKLFEKFKDDFECIKGKDVAVLGVTFKPGTDDLREAPSLDMVKILLDYGVTVSVYDPVGLPNFKKMFGDTVSYAETVDFAIRDKDVAFILTEWPEIKLYPLINYLNLMKTPILYDGRNCYQVEEARRLGLTYKSIGR